MEICRRKLLSLLLYVPYRSAVGTHELEDIEVYSAYIGYDWTEEERTQLLDWVGVNGGGVLLTGEYDSPQTAEQLFDTDKINR